MISDTALFLVLFNNSSTVLSIWLPGGEYW